MSVISESGKKAPAAKATPEAAPVPSRDVAPKIEVKAMAHRDHRKALQDQFQDADPDNRYVYVPASISPEKLAEMDAEICMVDVKTKDGGKKTREARHKGDILIRKPGSSINEIIAAETLSREIVAEMADSESDVTQTAKPKRPVRA